MTPSLLIGEGLEDNYGLISGAALPYYGKAKNGDIPDINIGYHKDFGGQPSQEGERDF